MKLIKRPRTPKENLPGFTMIEVMMVLAITGLMLVGLIGSTYMSISRQRYNDSLNSFAEYLSRIYSEVISPESFGKGNSSDTAVLGKVLVFGEDYDDSLADSRAVYSATLVGTADINRASDKEFIEELMLPETQVRLFCGIKDKRDSTVLRYGPLWEAELMQAENNKDERFKGTVIIARTPASNTVHTIYAKDLTYNLRDRCTPDNSQANTQFIEDFKHANTYYTIDQTVRICVDSENGPVNREVTIAPDGSNTSAISVMPESESQCRR